MVPESNAEKSMVEDGSEESEDDESDQVSTFDENISRNTDFSRSDHGTYRNETRSREPSPEHVYPEERAKVVAVAFQEKENIISAGL
jgi:hypothetical protein